jgi:hypothetical protein
MSILFTNICSFLTEERREKGERRDFYCGFGGEKEMGLALGSKQERRLCQFLQFFPPLYFPHEVEVREDMGKSGLHLFQDEL